MRKTAAWPERETYNRCSNTKLVHSGKEYFELLESMIRESEKLLHLQVYILEDDKTGLRIIKALKYAVRRGVEVHVVVDAFGSNSLSDATIDDMKEAGINFRKFSPFFTPKGLSIGRRLHHKIVVADSRQALVGGINISDNYHGTREEPAWIDYALIFEGPLVEHAENICEDILRKRRFFAKKRPKEEKPAASPGSGMLMRFRQNDWLRKKRQISSDYRHAIKNSKSTVMILASYFLPGRQLTRLLLEASRRGVEIKIILSGRSDVPFVKRATSYLYRQLLGQGIQIYECTTTVVHGKVAVVDGEWTTVGSYNLNHLSDFGSIELNADILDHDFSVKIEKELQQVIDKLCAQITIEEYEKRKTIIGKAIDWSAHQLLRTSMQLFFFLVRKNFRSQIY